MTAARSVPAAVCRSKEMAARGSTRRLTALGADADKGIPLLYRLKEGERWTLLDRDRAMVVHPERQPKIVYPDGRVEEIASNTEA